MVNTHLMIGLATDDRKAGTGVPATLTCSEVAPLITPGTLVVNHWLLDLPLDLRIGGFQLVASNMTTTPAFIRHR